MQKESLSATVILLLVTALIPAALAQELPPRAIHYSGRLATTSGTPIQAPQTMWFSLYVGGDAETTGSGTLRYRERTSIRPDVNGVFEHLIGSDATVEYGAIDPADFATTDSVYIQVAVGAVNQAMMPRTRFSSVGYAFQAANATGDITPRSVAIAGFGRVIDANGRWVGAALPGLGAPQVVAVEDVTGGRTVPGDLVRVTGSGLEAASVTIGGREAPIKSRGASEIVCQVPAGLAVGRQEIMVAAGEGASLARVVGAIELTRYLVAISPAAKAVWILDPNELAHDRTPVVTRITGLGMGTHAEHIQPAFAREGALLLVPSNQSNKIFAIDLTRNPPAPIDTTGFSVTGTSHTAAVEAAGDVLVVADTTANRLRAVNVARSFPPYASMGALMSNETDEAYQPPALPAGFAPRGMRFVGGETLMVLGGSSLLTLHRRLAAGAAEGDRRRFSLDAAPDANSANVVLVGPGAFRFVLTPDRTRAIVLRSGGTLLCFDAPNVWAEAGTASGAAVALGADVAQACIAPDGRTMLAAGFSVAEGQSRDRLHLIALEGKDLKRTGLIEGPANRAANHFRIAALEPIEGRTVAIATSDRSVYFYRREGASLERLNFEGPLVEGELAMGSDFAEIDTLDWQP